MSAKAAISTMLAFLLQTVVAAAQPSVALSGTVSSSEEGAMEGVLVSAHREGSNITVTVVSDASGQYAFPALAIGPGPLCFGDPRRRLRSFRGRHGERFG